MLYDAAAVSLLPAFATRHGGPFLSLETLKLRVTDDGWTREDAKKGRPVRCALAWTAREAWEASVAELLSSPAQVEADQAAQSAAQQHKAAA